MAYLQFTQPSPLFSPSPQALAIEAGEAPTDFMKRVELIAHARNTNVADVLWKSDIKVDTQKAYVLAWEKLVAFLVRNGVPDPFKLTKEDFATHVIAYMKELVMGSANAKGAYTPVPQSRASLHAHNPRNIMCSHPSLPAPPTPLSSLKAGPSASSTCSLPASGGIC